MICTRRAGSKYSNIRVWCWSQLTLLPGATILTGNRFFTAQTLFILLSSPDIANQAVLRIPSGPKSNCYFLLKMGADFMDYEKSRANKARIQDKIRDGTGAWDVNTFNFDFYQVKDNILTTSKTRRYEHPRPHYDLRTHRATYSTKVSAPAEFSRNSVFWFWNTPLSPSPGFAVISYLWPPYEPKPHGNAK